jgi:heme-degrading monooxygenase HmoA
MFARVITAQADAEGFDDLVSLVRQQLPGAREQAGFQGFYLLTDAATGQAVTISLWSTREEMEAVSGGGVRDETAPGTWVTPPQLATYEVTVRA